VCWADISGNLPQKWRSREQFCVVSRARLRYAGFMLSQKPWRAEAVIQLVAGVFACVCLGVLAVNALHMAKVAAFRTPDSFGNVLVATLSFQGAAWILIPVFLKLHDVNWRVALGVQDARWKKSLLLAVGVLVLVLPVVLCLEQFSTLALEKIDWKPEAEPAVALLNGANSWWMRGYLAFFAMALAPVAEEFIFRGILHPFVKQLGWPRLAWLGVSFLFAAIHVNLPTLVPLFVLALALTWLYERTDCLLAPIAAHSLFNAINLVMLFSQSR
jgi:membrane protease YdiL (CAAX protease family)